MPPASSASMRYGCARSDNANGSSNFKSGIHPSAHARGHAFPGFPGGSGGVALKCAQKLSQCLFGLCVEAFGIDVTKRPLPHACERVWHYVFARLPERVPPVGGGPAPPRGKTP